MTTDSSFAAVQARIARLSALPVIDARLLEVLGEPDPQAQYELLVNVLQADPSLAARVLKVANSAFYGGARTISTIEAALRVLGTLAVTGVAMAASLDGVAGRLHEADGKFCEALRRHSLTVAVAARHLARRVDDLLWTAGAAFVLGLLHDLGWLVKLQLDRDERLEALARAIAEPPRSEHAAAVADHALLGAALLAHWRLPQKLVDAVRYHDLSSQRVASVSGAALLCLADQCVRRGNDPIPLEQRQALPAWLLEAYHLCEDELAALAVQYAGEAAAIDALVH